MSRPILAPLAVALSALLIAPPIQADPTSPLFVVEQQRAALVSRLARQWSDAFAAFPKERRLDHEQLSNTLFALRADRLFAVSLAGDADAVEAVLAEAKREAAKPRAAAKALGDATANLTYTPINPCRILDTRYTPAGPLAANVARTFDGYATNFGSQGGAASGCGIPSGVAALAMNVYAVNPTNLGFIKVWPANAAEPDVSTVNYQVGIAAIATGALVPVDQANSNRFTAKSPATVDFIADVVGYFKPPGDGVSLDIKVYGQRVMRYEFTGTIPNVIGGGPMNGVTAGAEGATIAGGGGISLNFGPNLVTDHFGTIGGGFANVAGDYSAALNDASFATVGGGMVNGASGSFSTIGGGSENKASGGSSTIGGGSQNAASGGGSTVGGGGSNVASGAQSTIGGGTANVAGPSGTIGGGVYNSASGIYGAIVGGYSNSASGEFSIVGAGSGNVASGDGATIAGGNGNTAGNAYAAVGGGQYNSASGTYATISGGRLNVASGSASFVSGTRAKTQTADPTPVVHDGTFMFADSSPFDFHSTAANQFAARVTGGVRFVTAIDMTGAPSWTCGVSGGAGGSWGCSSDRNLKTDLVPLDGVATLERLAALPIYQWAAKDDPRRTPHAGPTAQDFMAAFGLGDNDKMIGFADAQGVLFAALQGLNAKFEQVVRARDTAIAALKAESDAQKQEVADLRRAVEALLARTSPEGSLAVRR